jgi:CheY-like chemotaxis protein
MPAKGLLFVVSRDALDRYEYLKRVFAGDSRVRVILDRRAVERRKTPVPPGGERRRADRRSSSEAEDRLRQQGWAMVRVELPLDAPVPASGDAVRPVEPEPARTPVRSVLVVDDDSRLTRLLEDVLRGDGYRVATARNGVDALALLVDQAFDLLLVDIRMPELDGPSLYRELERRTPAQARRVMFMTGGAVDADTAELLSTSRTPVLRKPLEVNELRGTVKRFLLAADSFRRRP